MPTIRRRIGTNLNLSEELIRLEEFSCTSFIDIPEVTDIEKIKISLRKEDGVVEIKEPDLISEALKRKSLIKNYLYYITNLRENNLDYNRYDSGITRTIRVNNGCLFFGDIPIIEPVRDNPYYFKISPYASRTSKNTGKLISYLKDEGVMFRFKKKNLFNVSRLVAKMDKEPKREEMYKKLLFSIKALRKNAFEETDQKDVVFVKGGNFYARRRAFSNDNYSNNFIISDYEYTTIDTQAAIYSRKVLKYIVKHSAIEQFNSIISTTSQKIHSNDEVDRLIGNKKIPSFLPHKFTYNHDTKLIDYNIGAKTHSIRPGKGVDLLMRVLGVARNYDSDPKGYEKIKEVILHKMAAPPEHELKIVSGSDIIKYYNYRRYDSSKNVDSLGSSCLRYDTCAPFLDMLVKNTKLLILYSEKKDLIIGRALLWENIKSENPKYKGKKFNVMDRIYGSQASREVFKEWAIKNNYLYRSHQVRGTSSSWMLNGKKVASMQELRLFNIVSREIKYPYLDSFHYSVKLPENKLKLFAYEPSPTFTQEDIKKYKTLYRMSSTEGKIKTYQNLI